MAPDARPPRWVAVLFLLSGMAALGVETIWLRWFRLLFGATAPAAAATLVAFFAGHALGAGLAARWIPGRARPLRIYAGLELAAGAWALAVPGLLRLGELALAAVYDPLRDAPWALATLRFAIAGLATLPASACLGATLPAIAAAVLPGERALGSGGAGLYAANLLGAALGAAASAFLLIDALGVPATYACAVALHAGVGLAAWGLSRGLPRPPEPAPPPPPGEPPLRFPRPALLPLAALSGFGTFAAQVLGVQAFGQVLNQSVYAFGAVLVVVLVTLALGAGVVAAAQRARIDPRTLLGASLLLAALGLWTFPTALYAATDELRFLGSQSPWPGYLGRALGIAALTAGPALLGAGLVFPSLFALAGRSRRGSDPAAHLGRLVAANTAGALCGALAAPFLLMPLAGLWRGFLVLGALYALPAALLPDASRGRWGLRALGLAAGVLLVIEIANPARIPLVRLARNETLVHVESTPSGVVAVVERPDGRLIRTDNHYMLGGDSEKIHEERQGHLPLLLHPKARRVAYVGTASGITAGASTAHSVEEIYLVEIVPGVARAAQRFFSRSNRGVPSDPRARVVVDDARNFFRSTRVELDVVVADLFVPWRAGVGSLYAHEHFSAIRDRLAPGGLFCQWLPLYQLTEEQLRIIAATFLDVFPRAALFRGDFFARYPIVALVGYTGPPARPEEVAGAARRLARRGEPDRWIRDPLGVFSLYAGPLEPLAEELQAAPRSSDASPRLEFLAARSHAGGERGIEAPFVLGRWLAFEKRLRELREARGDPIYPGLAARQRRAALGGEQLRAAGVAFAAGREAEASRALEAAAALLPRRLFADAEPDPTIAEVWTR